MTLVSQDHLQQQLFPDDSLSDDDFPDAKYLLIGHLRQLISQRTKDRRIQEEDRTCHLQHLIKKRRQVKCTSNCITNYSGRPYPSLRVSFKPIVFLFCILLLNVGNSYSFIVIMISLRCGFRSLNRVLSCHPAFHSYSYPASFFNFAVSLSLSLSLYHDIITDKSRRYCLSKRLKI